MSQVDPQVVEIVNNIIHQKFEVPRENLLPGAHLKNDLNLDSLDFVDMFVMLEQSTGQTVQNVDFMAISTLGDIYSLVASLNIQKPVN